MSWVEKKTMDGLLYWYDTSSKAATWEKPWELRSEEERQPGDWTWVPHPTDFWQPARKVKENADGSVECETRDKKIIVVPKSREMQDANTDGRTQKVPLWPLKKYTLDHVEDDLIFLDEVNDGAICYNLAEHFKKQGLYTYVGASHRVLVAINPYQRLPLYGEDQITLHRDKSPNIDVPPHIFDIADGSYTEMLYDGKHQSILISGESGAGKTEATKHCLKYWAKVAGSKNGVEERLVQANPVLEAFGNAKTIRNNNSSRFGKWVEVYFDQLAQSIDGAIIINYLLEKSRLVFQQGGERNFHIFYYLMTSSEAKSEYGLRDPKSHKLTCNGLCDPVKGMDDAKDFQDAKKAMIDLDFSNEEREWMLRLPSALIHLGDVTFSEQTQAGNVKGSKIADDAPLKMAAKLLDVNPEELRKVLCFRSISVNRETSVIPLDPAAARAGCDSIVKGVYSRMFDWLVARCNKALNGDTSGKFVGILDIFGFEIFEVNSFEQLCINFCNEKLQQLFNIETFRDEEQLYINEGIKYDPITFKDSQDVLNMIEKPPNGILPVLDDECKLPEGNDDKYMGKINANFKDHAAYGSAAKRKLVNKLSFDIIHYAGQVCYAADEFMLKNKDTFFQDAYDMCGKSTHACTKQLFPSGADRLQVKSLSSVFRQQLNVLMDKLRTTSTRYVRCIKPNETMSPLTFEAPLVMRQLMYSGVFEAVAIRKQGYPFRMPFQGFAFRYKAINPDHVYRNTDPRKLCEEVLEVSPSDFKEVVFGKTMVFYKATTYKQLKLLRNLALETIIPRVQGILRGALSRAMRFRLKKLENAIDAAIALQTEYDPLKDALDSIDKVLSSLGKRLWPKLRPRNEAKGRDYLKGLKIWADAENDMVSVLKTDVQSNYPAYWRVYETVQPILHVAKNKRQQGVYEEVESAVKSQEKGLIDIALYEARARMIRADLKSGVERAEQAGHSSPPLQEAKRVLALNPKSWFELELTAAEKYQDAPRAEQCKFRLWEIEMTTVADSYARWSNYNGLRAPMEYAKGKWFGKQSCAEGMCVAEKAVVNQPLTKPTDPQFKQSAKQMNKGILGYCGVKPHPQGADAAGLEALRIASQSNELRDELFCQLMKAASPSQKVQDSSAYDKAYELLGVALYINAPANEDLLKHVFKFACKKDIKYAKAASQGKFKPNKAGPRSATEISRIAGEINGGMGTEGTILALA